MKRGKGVTDVLVVMKRGKGVPEVVAARKNLLDLLNRLKDPDAEQYLLSDWGPLFRQLRDALADMVPTASDDDVVRLESALAAAFYIGARAPKNPFLPASLAKLRTASATKRKQEKKAEVGHLVRQWRAKGIKRVDKLQEMLAALGIKRSLATIYDYLKQDDSFQK
jgi:hypothetical protein